MLQEKTPSATSGNSIVQVTKREYNRLADFYNQNILTHRHLDWITPLDWVGRQPYLMHQSGEKIQSVLCTTPENAGSAWIRVFAIQKSVSPEKHWQMLLPRALQMLQENHVRRLAALALHPWFRSLLMEAGFANRQNVIVLEWQGTFPTPESCNPEVQIRPLVFEDLPTVSQIDHLAFPSLWENSMLSLTKALKQTGVSSVATLNGEIVGYQISTTMTIYGHLARLAVHPEYQRMGIAYTLVYDLLKTLDQRGFWRVTVNTQSDNAPSLALYRRFGFTPTQEEIKVYERAL
jgi:ribosomal protein S18 acetylase RimI-like enzyme